jgi:hypothetical protein
MARATGETADSQDARQVTLVVSSQSQKRTLTMKVSIKSFDVAMEVKNKGVELDIYDNDGNHLGDLVVTKAKVIWCKG